MNYFLYVGKDSLTTHYSTIGFLAWQLGRPVYMSHTSFAARLMDWHEKNGRRGLPWRRPGTDPYQVWVSEIMLQQTQVARVIPYYRRFIKRFPRVAILARASWKDFLPYYEGLGYYRRGRNMLATAKLVVERHSGKFPTDRQALQALPGIGPYTASAIMSFAHGADELAFDTNVRRVLGRFYFGDKRAPFKPEFFQKKFKAKKAQLNAGLMDFANSVCLNRPRCEICPVAKNCQYFKTRGAKEFQPPVKRVKFPLSSAQVYLWLHENHKKYYSSRPDEFSVFVLPPEHNTRGKIKAYFNKKYRLKLSVRPPHQRTYIKGIPTLYVNSQILSGRPEFAVFSRQEILGLKVS